MTVEVVFSLFPTVDAMFFSTSITTIHMTCHQ
jgi:hypothetical protein